MEAILTTREKEEVPGASYTTFEGLFTGERSFTIPEYQRAYDWGEDQRTDLLDDIDRLDQLIEAGQESSHFCGTIICTPPTETNQAHCIVDGQQRLTTLALLHARLASVAKRATFLRSEGKMLFTPQSADANTFGRLLSGKNPGTTDTIAQSNYVRASDELDAWIGTDAKRAGRILNHVEQRLHFIFFVLPDETEVAKVFETINNRGKPLSQMDLVKNHLIYIAAVRGWTEPNVNEVWRGIQKIAGSTHFVEGDVDTILRAVVTAQFRPGRRNAGETDFSIVSNGLPALNAKHEVFETFLRFLEASFWTHANMRSANKTDIRKPIDRALTFLNHHNNIGGVLPLIFARQFRRHDFAADRKTAKVLEAVEIANFRLYGLPGASARSDSHNVTLHRLAYEYFHGNRSDDEVIVELTKTVTQSQKDGLASILRSLSLNDDDGYDFYKWPWLRYFLARFEEHLLDSQSFDFSRLRLRIGQTSRTNDVLTIEHIWPRKAEKQTVEQDNDGQQIRRLGNLMLIPHKVNIQRSNGDLKFKAEKTADSSAVLLQQNVTAQAADEFAVKFSEYLVQRNDELFGEVKNRFNEPTIEANSDLVRVRTLCDLREEDMIRFALEAWRFPGENGMGHVFEGMFSLPSGGETYLPTREDAIKENENYVMRAEYSARGKRPAAFERLAKRRKVIGNERAPIAWK
ncbi:DUF262 domain-containing protein [Rhodobacteraceae bacterium 63075]|nr:DUF262 domain-containing protein [Rhodobacteraceae bacterium 63075]